MYKRQILKWLYTGLALCIAILVYLGPVTSDTRMAIHRASPVYSLNPYIYIDLKQARNHTFPGGVDSTPEALH